MNGEGKGVRLTNRHLESLARCDSAGVYTFRTDSRFAKLERLNLVLWRETRGVSDDVGRFYATEAGRAALTQPQEPTNG